MKSKIGISIVEVVIAIAIVLSVGVVFASGLAKSLDVSQKALRTSQASWLLEDSAEAIKSIRDSAWSNIGNLTPGLNYYLVFDVNTNSWSITQTDPGPIDNIFSRSFSVSPVNRDANDDISLVGTNDVNTKYININVSWQSGANVVTKNLDFYISKIF